MSTGIVPSRRSESVPFVSSTNRPRILCVDDELQVLAGIERERGRQGSPKLPANAIPASPVLDLNTSPLDQSRP